MGPISWGRAKRFLPSSFSTHRHRRVVFVDHRTAEKSIGRRCNLVFDPAAESNQSVVNDLGAGRDTGGWRHYRPDHSWHDATRVWERLRRNGPRLCGWYIVGARRWIAGGSGSTTMACLVSASPRIEQLQPSGGTGKVFRIRTAMKLLFPAGH